jgi:hypothetical protein
LRVEFKLQLARQVLPHEFGILAHEGGDHLPDLTALQQDAEAEAVDARVVRGDGEVLGPRLPDRGDEEFGNAADSEAAGCDGHAVEQQTLERGAGAGVGFLHVFAPASDNAISSADNPDWKP